MTLALSSANAKTEMAFTDAAELRRCVWPIRGSGALMIVCGCRRGEGDLAYCLEHRRLSQPPSAR